MSVTAIPIVLILVGCAVVTGLIVVAVSVRRQEAQQGPRCGNCGYNLTGAPSNRCPECGELFIEAGVVTGKQSASVSPRARRALMLAVVGLTVLAALGMASFAWLSGTARSRAVAARRTSAQTPARPQPAARQSPTTAPAAEDRSVGQPPETP